MLQECEEFVLVSFEALHQPLAVTVLIRIRDEFGKALMNHMASSGIDLRSKLPTAQREP